MAYLRVETLMMQQTVLTAMAQPRTLSLELVQAIGLSGADWIGRRRQVAAEHV